MSTSPPKPGERRMLEGLDDVRAQLDEVDQRIVAALVERDRLVMEVARRKAQKDDGRVRDPVREEALLSRLSSHGQAAGLDGFYVTRVFRELLDHSVRLQQEFLARRRNPDRAPEGELVVAYPGTDGAHGHLAALRHFGPRGGSLAFRGYPSSRAMMEAVRDGHAQYGMLPIENTTAGSIDDAFDLLAQMDVSVVGEEIQKVDHCLIALEPVPLSRIRRIFAHPQAIAQCSTFLEGLADCHVEAFADNPLSVQRVAQEQDLSQAVIAGEEAAMRNGLVVLKRDLANQRENYTRMMVIAARPEKVDARVAAKTSLIFATKHEQGALLSCLNALAERSLNLTKIESRPRPNTPWEYLFYVDFEGNIEAEPVAQALAELRARASYLRVLGSYPARTPREARAAVSPAPGEDESGIKPSREPLHPRTLERAAHPLSSRRAQGSDSVVEVGSALIGGPAAVVIARVRTIPSRASLLDTARAARAAGAGLLRAPCFEPAVRDQCDAFGADPLELLEEVGRIAGLPVVAELLHASDVDRAARRADLLVVGAAQMQDVSLLREVGRVDRPVVLERAGTASIDEWLAAAEYVLERGNQRVVLCERGIRTFERATPTTLDISAVALLRERSHLPVIVDPSQAAGQTRLALRLAASARAAGAHGVVIDVQLGAAADDAASIDDLAGLVARLQGA